MPKAGSFEETESAELVAIRRATLPRIQSGRPEIQFDDAGKAGSDAIIVQHSEQAPRRPCLPRIHQLPGSPMCPECPQDWVFPDHTSAPTRLFQLPFVQNPHQLDIQSPLQQIRQPCSRGRYQLARLGKITEAVPSSSIEDEQGRLGDHSWHRLEEFRARQFGAPIRAIINGVQPPFESLSTIAGDCPQRTPRTSGIADRETGLTQQKPDLRSECARGYDRQEIAHRVPVEIVEASPGPDLESFGVAIPQRAVQEEPRIVLTVEICEQPMHRIRLERRAIREAQFASALNDRQLTTPVLDPGFRQTRVEDEESWRQAVRCK
jgi:hypothetical protein